MKIDYTGRGVEITDRIRNYTESKLERLNKLLENIQDLSVVISIEKYRHRAEIHFQTEKRSFHGQDETNDTFQSIDGAIAKLETQVKKYKKKQNTRKRGTLESIRVNVLSLPEEKNQSRPGDRTIEVIRSDNSEVKPMNLDEALDELDKLKQEFIIFRNSDNDHVNVLYHRKDGNIGLIEPGN